MIHEILQEGAENAQTGKEICNLLNISMRDLNTAVEQERRQGEPICAGSGDTPGYYLAANGGEMTRFCRRLEHRKQEIEKTCKACRRTAATMQRQEAGKHGKESGGDQ